MGRPNRAGFTVCWRVSPGNTVLGSWPFFLKTIKIRNDILYRVASAGFPGGLSTRQGCQLQWLLLDSTRGHFSVLGRNVKTPGRKAPCPKAPVQSNIEPPLKFDEWIGNGMAIQAVPQACKFSIWPPWLCKRFRSCLWVTFVAGTRDWATITENSASLPCVAPWAGQPF